jgi:hypothetical protein
MEQYLGKINAPGGELVRQQLMHSPASLALAAQTEKIDGAYYDKAIVTQRINDSVGNNAEDIPTLADYAVSKPPRTPNNTVEAKAIGVVPDKVASLNNVTSDMFIKPEDIISSGGGNLIAPSIAAYDKNPIPTLADQAFKPPRTPNNEAEAKAMGIVPENVISSGTGVAPSINSFDRHPIPTLADQVRKAPEAQMSLQSELTQAQDQSKFLDRQAIYAGGTTGQKIAAVKEEIANPHKLLSAEEMQKLPVGLGQEYNNAATNSNKANKNYLSSLVGSDIAPLESTQNLVRPPAGVQNNIATGYEAAATSSTTNASNSELVSAITQLVTSLNNTKSAGSGGGGGGTTVSINAPISMNSTNGSANSADVSGIVTQICNDFFLNQFPTAFAKACRTVSVS